MSANRMAASTPSRERLQRDLERELGRPAELEQRVLLAQRAVLGHVAPRLPHHPDGRAVDGLAPARAQEAIVHHNLFLAASTAFWNTSSASALSAVKFQVFPPFCFTRKLRLR